MTDNQQIVPRILLSTDFSESSERAFYHALSFAVAREARLTLLHTGSESREDVPWERFPGVRETLVDWGLLKEGAPRAAVADQLNLGVAKMAMRDDDPRQGITDYLRKHPTDLLVMATEGRRGLARIFHASVAETVAYNTRSNTLLLPSGGREMVSAETGEAELERVLCVLDPECDSERTLSILSSWLNAFGGKAAEVLVLRIHAEEDDPLILPATGTQQWRQDIRSGDRTELILSAAEESDPGLIVTSTQSLLGLRGRIRGSIADRVLRQLKLPLLTVSRL